MLKNVFLTVVNLSIVSSILIIFNIIIRKVFSQSPKWTRYILWGIVAVRLIIPFFIETKFNFLPDTGFSLLTEENMVIDQNYSILIDNTISTGLSEPQNFSHGGNDTVTIVSRIWLTGMVVMLIVFVFEYLMLARKIKYAVSIKKMEEYLWENEKKNSNRIYFVDGIKTPFTMGIIKPKIFIPSVVRLKDLEYIISHESVHIRRGDYLWKPAGYFILTVHWFNPLVWIAYILFGRDIEYACDESVIRKIGLENDRGYIEALLHSIEESDKKLFFNGVTFGSVPIRRRLKEIMNIKKVSALASVITLAAGIGIGAFFFMKPVKGRELNENTELQKIKTENAALTKELGASEETAIIVPEEEWVELGIKEAIHNQPNEPEEITEVLKWYYYDEDGEIKKVYKVSGISSQYKSFPIYIIYNAESKVESYLYHIDDVDCLVKNEKRKNPEWIRAKTQDGTIGFLRYEDLSPEDNINTIEEALEWNKIAAFDRVIPMYNAEGEIIDEWIIPGTKELDTEELRKEIGD